MSLITRFNGAFKAFASEATGTFRTVFGDITQSDDLTDNLTSDFKKGWEIVGTNNEPTIEDFNAMGYTLSQVLAYIHQVGIIEWNGTDGVVGGQDYYANKSYVGYGGNIYLALLDSGGSIEARIPTNATYWKNITNSVLLTGNQTVAGIKTFSSSPIVPVPTTNLQSVPLRSSAINVNVGTGQTYTTINQALEYLSAFYPMYKKAGVTATIILKSGFVMDEQVLVSGIDLGWITIVGEDAETIITHTALTTAFNDGSYPAFGVDKGGACPVIGHLFRFNVEKVGGEKHGVMTFGAGSSADVLSGKGFIGAGTYGILAANSSTINASGANCSNAGTSGIIAGSGSTISASGANCSNAGTYGILAYTGSTINASGANCSNAGTYGILAYDVSTINASGANCSNAGTSGIIAGSGSTISAIGAIIQDQITGTARVRVENGATIKAITIDTTGGTVPVFSQAVNILTASGIIYG